MGGLGPGIGGFELVVIAIVALVVVGPKDLPVMMRKVGRLVGKARAMAAEFRSSFDEMARQSELDDLRKEVEALRTNRGIHRLGADADAAFREINSDLTRDLKPTTVSAATTAAVRVLAAPLTSPDGWSEVDNLTAPPVEPAAAAKPKAKAPSKAKASPKPRAAAKPKSAATSQATETKPKRAPAKSAPGKAPAARKSKS
jgi:sec-independent protein translocase protein TatB